MRMQLLPRGKARKPGKIAISFIYNLAKPAIPRLEQGALPPQAQRLQHKVRTAMRLELLLLLTVFLTAACDAPSAPRRFAAVVASTDFGLEVKEVPEAALKALGVA